MEISTQYSSPLKMKNLLISKCIFRRSEDELKDLKIDVNIKRKIDVLDANNYKVSLEISMSDNAKKIEIFVECVAFFETEQGFIPLIERNAIAIMFPYLRSYVSIITAQPGMMPIVLPPMNIAAMFQDD